MQAVSLPSATHHLSKLDPQISGALSPSPEQPEGISFKDQPASIRSRANNTLPQLSAKEPLVPPRSIGKPPPLAHVYQRLDPPANDSKGEPLLRVLLLFTCQRGRGTRILEQSNASPFFALALDHSATRLRINGTRTIPLTRRIIPADRRGDRDTGRTIRTHGRPLSLRHRLSTPVSPSPLVRSSVPRIGARGVERAACERVVWQHDG